MVRFYVTPRIRQNAHLIKVLCKDDSDLEGLYLLKLAPELVVFQAAARVWRVRDLGLESAPRGFGRYGKKRVGRFLEENRAGR